MKKTLFTMMTVAFCGTAFAYQAHNTSEFSQNATLFITEKYELNIDSNTKFAGIYAEEESGSAEQTDLTLNFTSGYALQSRDVSFKMMDECDAKLSITAGVSVLQNWESILLSNTNITTIATLVDVSRYLWFDVTDDKFTFLTTTCNEFDFLNPTTVTLGNTTADFFGLFNEGNSMSDVENWFNVQGGYTSKVALLNTGKQLLLVGRTDQAPNTPEPATATLSLMALAGLVARRRRK